MLGSKGMSALGLFDSDPAGPAWKERGSLPEGTAAQEHVHVLVGPGLRLSSLESTGASLKSHGTLSRDICGAASPWQQARPEPPSEPGSLPSAHHHYCAQAST